MNLPFGKKKSEEPEYQPLFADSINYARYECSVLERILARLGGFVVGFTVGIIFYALLPIGVVFGVVVAVAAGPLYRDFMAKRRMKALKVQFRDMLEAVSTSISAGQNTTDAFISAYADLRLQYSDTSYIVRELGQIVAGMNNNINIEVLLNDFAQRSGIDDIANFANVFETSYRKGGNIREVVKSTYDVINDKMQIQMEIETMMASSKAELNMMMCMPVLITLMMRFMGGSLTNMDSPLAMVSTTAAILIFIGAYAIGSKIMTVKL